MRMRPTRSCRVKPEAPLESSPPPARRTSTRHKTRTQLFTFEVPKSGIKPREADLQNGDHLQPTTESKTEEVQDNKGAATFTIALDEASFARWTSLKAEFGVADDVEVFQSLLSKIKDNETRSPGTGKSEACLGVESAPYVKDAILEEDQHQPDREGPQSSTTEIKHAPTRKASRKCERPARREPSEEDLSERILKRKRIGDYDCRKTPNGGIVASLTSASRRKRSTTDKATAAMAKAAEEETDQIEDDGEDEKVFGRLSLSTSWCRNCDAKHENTPCPYLRPEVVITDSVIDFSNKSGGADTSNVAKTGISYEKTKNVENHFHIDNLDLSKSFAQLSLPSPLLLREREPHCGLTVTARQSVKAFTQFGPLQGEPILERDIPEDFAMKDLWQIFTPDSRRLYVSTVNPEKSNWLRYLRPADSRKLRNVVAVVAASDDSKVSDGNIEDRRDDKSADFQLYFVTNRDVAAGEELLFWIDDPDLMWTRKRAEKKNCGGCTLRFSHTLYYRLHCTVFHDPHFSLTIRKYHCKMCGLAVLGKDNIVKHAQAEHGGKGAYQCQFCKKFFLRLNYLDMHRTYGCASNPDRTRPKCHVCGKKFCQPQKLKIHIRRMHSETAEEMVKELKCEKCHKILGNKTALRRHKREVHSDFGSSDGSTSNSNSTDNGATDTLSADDASARVACSKCGRTFKNKSNLKIHMLTHSGVKPFGCKVESCKSGFTTKQCLQFHYRKAHGLSEDQMPKIEREIPYTLSAYSGGLIDDDDKKKGSSVEVNTSRNSKSDRVSNNATRRCETDAKKEEKATDDVYQFEDEDEDGEVEESGKHGTATSFKHFRKSDKEKLGEPKPPKAEETNKASMLVVAALEAAANDLRTRSGKHAGDKDLAETKKQEDEDDSQSPSGKRPEPDEALKAAASTDVGESNSGCGSTLSHSTMSLITSTASQVTIANSVDSTSSTSWMPPSTNVPQDGQTHTNAFFADPVSTPYALYNSYNAYDGQPQGSSQLPRIPPFSEGASNGNSASSNNRVAYRPYDTPVNENTPVQAPRAQSSSSSASPTSLAENPRFLSATYHSQHQQPQEVVPSYPGFGHPYPQHTSGYPGPHRHGHHHHHQHPPSSQYHSHQQQHHTHAHQLFQHPHSQPYQHPQQHQSNLYLDVTSRFSPAVTTAPATTTTGSSPYQPPPHHGDRLFPLPSHAPNPYHPYGYL